MGGLLGGLLEGFDAIGRAVFTFLIGARRAEHPSLTPATVFVGGAIPGMILFTLLFLFQWESWFVSSNGVPKSAAVIIFSGVVCGVLVGGVFAIILFGISASIEEAEEEERREAARQAKERAEEEKRKRVRDIKRAKYRDDLIVQGVDPTEAEYRAEREVRDPSGGCFIATAVFDSPNASEVLTLRQWRDDTLLSFSFGRLFVKLYYLSSPHLVQPIKRHEWIKKRLKNILQLFVGAIEWGRKNN